MWCRRVGAVALVLLLGSAGCGEEGRCGFENNMVQQAPPAFQRGSLADNGAYQECTQIVENGIFATYSLTVVTKNINALVAKFCQLSEGEAAQEYRRLVSQVQQSQAQGSGEAKLDVLGIFTFGAGAEGGKLVDAEFSDEEFVKSFRQWKESSCGDYSNYSDAEKNYELITANPDSAAVSAWKECVTKRQSGLICTPSVSGDLVTVTVSYRKSAFTMPDVLDLRWATVENLQPRTKKLFEAVAHNPDIEQGGLASFAVTDPSKPARIDINGVVSQPTAAGSGGAGAATREVVVAACGVTVPARRAPFVVPRLTEQWHRVNRSDISMELPEGHELQDGRHLGLVYQGVFAVRGLAVDGNFIAMDYDLLASPGGCGLENATVRVIPFVTNEGRPATYLHSVSRRRQRYWMHSVFLYESRGMCLSLEFSNYGGSVSMYHLLDQSEIADKVWHIAKSVSFPQK